jgi:hypothetical protein
VGKYHFNALAQTVVDPMEYRRALLRWAQQGLRTAPPACVERVLRLLGFDYEASIRRHVDENPPAPIVALRPLRTA